jgi:hypothetical protein
MFIKSNWKVAVLELKLFSIRSCLFKLKLPSAFDTPPAFYVTPQSFECIESSEPWATNPITQNKYLMQGLSK